MGSPKSGDEINNLHASLTASSMGDATAIAVGKAWEKEQRTHLSPPAFGGKWTLLGRRKKGEEKNGEKNS